VLVAVVLVAAAAPGSVRVGASRITGWAGRQTNIVGRVAPEGKEPSLDLGGSIGIAGETWHPLIAGRMVRIREHDKPGLVVLRNKSEKELLGRFWARGLARGLAGRHAEEVPGRGGT